MAKPAGWWERRRHGMWMTSVMLGALQTLITARGEGCPALPLYSVHKRTINSLLQRRWIESCPDPAGVRGFSITVAGERAVRIFEKPPRRFDGICPTCGVRPKHVGKSGQRYGYCLECDHDYRNFRWHNRLNRINPNRLCSCCHQRPLHRMSGGKLSTYCTECRRAKRAEERRLRIERELARVRAGEVLLCRRCKQRPRAHTENYVRDYCPECQRIYMADYNDRRRPDSQAAKKRKG